MILTATQLPYSSNGTSSPYKCKLEGDIIGSWPTGCGEVEIQAIWSNGGVHQNFKEEYIYSI